MSVSLTALYNPPLDIAAFDKHYNDVHSVIAKSLPNLESFSVVRPGPGDDGAPSPFHLIATLTFPSAELMASAMGSPEGVAGQDDLKNFATAGVTMLVGEVSEFL